MAWTQEQQDAINYRDGNLLVSAAAGSGKTAVLIERIITKILDPQHPVDIDSIVVVTFTKAAAGEMKGRLARTFQRELEKNPDNRHLLKQLSLIDHARITTIDSFCTSILRNYYNAIELDPGYVIGDPGELELLKADVMEEMLEEYYTEGSKDFFDFVESYAPGKNLDTIGDLIQRLHGFAQSHPWPEEWLMECKDFYKIQKTEEYVSLPLVKDTTEYIRQVCRECIMEYDYMLELCHMVNGPEGYMATFQKDRDCFLHAMDSTNLKDLSLSLDFSFDRLGRCNKETDPGLKEMAMGLRNRIKKRHEKIITSYFAEPMEKTVENIRLSSGNIDIFIDLTLDFMQRYREKKLEKSILDFSDVEHYALQILLQKTPEGLIYTPIAEELANEIEEIYIDEYQDSNLVQELILGAVSKERFGHPNTFMVGDVKQSIYKFRMANPYIFMEKYHTYSPTEGPYRKIELHSNFRSRETVLESINDIFYKIMKKNIGGIEYNDQVRLNAGLCVEDEYDDRTQIIYGDLGEFKNENISSKEICAHIAADRIKQLMEADPELNYSDIVILLRSDRTGGPIYSSILNGHGIPCIHASSTGYFGVYEVNALLNLLKVIDNPNQEIELAAVMRSYFAKFTPEELALIKGSKRRTLFYDCVVAYGQQETLLGEKVRNFLGWLNEYRRKSKILSISELLSELIYETGYYDFIGMMNGGPVKRANVEMLLQKARAFQNTSYSGLFYFLRYIYKLNKYEVDYGEAKSASEENAVRIMSIHKSKGLEFPVVIIGDMGKKYNMSDTNDTVLFDAEYGIGTDYIDLDKRRKRKVAFKQMIARRMRSENIGEEMRILYVAMTRAVKKLIMIGAVSEKTHAPRWSMEKELGKVSENYILENPCYLDLVMANLYEENPGTRFQVNRMAGEEILRIAGELITGETISFQEKIQQIQHADLQESLFQQVRGTLEYEYPHRSVLSIRSKYAVSDLKHMAMEESALPEAHIVKEDAIKPTPYFLGKEEHPQGGIQRGNAYHKLFELLEYDKCADFEDYLRDLITAKKFTAEYAELISPDKCKRFLQSDLGKDMAQAQAAGLLFREQPFIMEISAGEVTSYQGEDEKVLIQGIIDAFFVKENGIYIVDYKTDRVPLGKEGEDVLKARYAKQLELYGNALKGYGGYEVKGRYLYSVFLDKCIDLQYN